jgi:S1-C subfamily serine protease
VTEHGPNGPGSEPADVRAPGADDAFYARPAGVEDAFAPRDPGEIAAAVYVPPPPTVSPDERAVFTAPSQGMAFAPAPGTRIEPRPSERPAVPRAFTDAFGATPQARDGFDPAPGTRIGPSGPVAESPWWKADARTDPWRDPSSPYWLGRGAVFSGDTPAQLDPAADTEHVEDEGGDDAADDDTKGSGGVVQRLRPGWRGVLFLVLLGLLVGAIGGGTGYWIAKRGDNLLHRSNVALAKTGKPANRPSGSIADIAKRVGPAVVLVAVSTPDQYAVGSGVVIDKNGYVLTNNHVVAAASGGKGSIVVTFADNSTAKAQIAGLDPTSDLAVLKVPNTKLTVASLGDSSTLAVGDPVIAIGSPLALQGTVTEGIVSALDRAVHIPDASGGGGIYLDAIQTDAAINHGNSGGALVDASGAVVGINSAAALNTPDPAGGSSSVSGIGFAIPINYARDIAQQLIRSGKAVHASFGTQGKTATTQDGLQSGAFLEQVVDGGPAAKAGLQAGDVVIAADGRAVPSYDQLVVVVQNRKPGDTISVTYVRGAAKHTTNVTLGSD